MSCYKIHITGTVFKNGFRYYLKEKADLSGITGKVYYKNESSVGVTVSGSQEGLRRFLEYCNIANPFFKIHKIEITEALPEEFSSFEVEDEIPDIVILPDNQQN